MWLLQVTTAARVGTHAYVNPVVAVALGWLIAREPLSWRILAGAAVIVGSVLLVNRSDGESKDLLDGQRDGVAAD